MTDLAQTDERLGLAGLRNELLRARGLLLEAVYGPSVDPSQDGHAERDGSAVAQRQAEATLTRLQRRTLAQINAALDRFDDGSYGTCIGCGHRIPTGRLEVMPSASRCLECQHQREASHAHDDVV